MTDRTTPIRERARAALERAKAATPGPWRECGADRGGCVCRVAWSTSADLPVVQALRDPDAGWEGCPLPTPEEADGNARFVAHAREDIPALSAFVLRITSPEMRRAVFDVLMRKLAPYDQAGEAADAIMALLTEETP